MKRTKESFNKVAAVKRFLMVVAFTLIFGLFFGYLGNIPFKPLLIWLLIFILLFMTPIAVISYHYREFIRKSRIFPYSLIVIGILTIMIFIGKLFIKKSTLPAYIDLIVGLYFIFWGVYMIKKKSIAKKNKRY